MSIPRLLVAAALLAPVAAVPAARVAPVPVAAPVHDHGTHSHAAAPAAARVRPAPVRRVRWDGRPFATPEAAMRFLVAAYNAHDDVAIRHVTTPDQRGLLLDMRGYAPRLRLRTCTRLDTGAYDCEFWHSLAEPGDGREGFATFRVAPAARPGWYMTILLECGDG